MTYGACGSRFRWPSFASGRGAYLARSGVRGRLRTGGRKMRAGGLGARWARAAGGAGVGARGGADGGGEGSGREGAGGGAGEGSGRPRPSGERGRPRDSWRGSSAVVADALTRLSDATQQVSLPPLPVVPAPRDVLDVLPPNIAHPAAHPSLLILSAPSSPPLRPFAVYATTRLRSRVGVHPSRISPCNTPPTSYAP